MINYSLFGYALASSMILIFCWLIYRILFEAKINPNINRKVLLAIYAMAFLIPFISSLLQFSRPAVDIKVGMLSLVDIPSTTSEFVFQDSGSFPVILPILTKIYLLGVGVMIIITFISIYKLLKLKKKACKIKMNGVDVYIHDNNNLASFSWFKTIFLYENALSHDTQILLEHEKAHVNFCHWLDLLIAQIFLIMQWFNPVVWIMRKELQQVHEYQADEKVLEKGYDEKSYQMLLLRNITNVYYPSFSDGFNNCSIKKRLLMMNRKNFKSQWWLRGTVVVGVAVLGGILLHVPAIASVIETKEQSQDNTNISVMNVRTMKKEDNPVVINEDTIGDTKIIIDGKEVPYEEFKKINPDCIESITVLQNPDKLIITIKDSYKQNYNVDTKETVRSNIKNPSYEGGEEKLSRDLAMRTRYPYEAYKDNIQGTVIVQFTVTKTGELKDFRIEKSVSTDLDVAAVNAVKDLPGRWTPGEIDGIKSDLIYSVPISFTIQ